MKVLLILAGLFLAVTASPLTPRTEGRWALIEDDSGRKHLSDLNPLIEPEPMWNIGIDLRFLLYTRNNPVTPQRIDSNPATVLASNWNVNNGVRFIVHGWNSDASSSVNTAITGAYLRAADLNVVVVDWSVGANTINYITARNRVSEVGIFLANFIDLLHLHSFTQFNQVHIVGHSLGPHIAGVAGKRVTRGRIHTIVGLDPAGPLFSLNSADRLAPGDAFYTEGIRTETSLIGFDLPLAQVDFYPSWGGSQPGCGIDLTGSCAHSRSHQFYAESINNNNFWGRRCAGGFADIQNRNCQPGGAVWPMGGEPGNAGRGIDGVFFLSVNGNSPFAQGPI